MNPEQILLFENLVQLIPLSRSTFWRLEREGKFPKRRPITRGRVGWVASEVQAWIATKSTKPASAS